MRKIKSIKSKHSNQYSRGYNSSYNSIPVGSMIVTSEVTKIEDITEFEDGSIRTSFRCKSETKKEDTLCIFWGRSCLEVGDLAYMKGRLKTDGTFLAWDLRIIKGVNKDWSLDESTTPPIEKGVNSEC